MKIPKITFWKAVLVLILVPGLYSLIYRLTHGLGQSTNLNDEFPWGLWVGFKLFSVALAGAAASLSPPSSTSSISIAIGPSSAP